MIKKQIKYEILIIADSKSKKVRIKKKRAIFKSPSSLDLTLAGTNLYGNLCLSPSSFGHVGGVLRALTL